MVVSGVLFIAVIVVVSVLMNRFVLSPLNDARRHCKLIAAGELDSPVVVKSGARSEIQSLMGSLEEMRPSLTAIIIQVRDSARLVSVVSSEIAAGNIIDLASRTE